MPEASVPYAGAIVALGATRESLDGIEAFLSRAPAKGALSYVVVHDIEGDTGWLERLGQCTSLRVRTAANGDRIEATRVYVAPPNAVLTIDQGVLRVMRATPTQAPIDTFFESLATDRRELGIGILLSARGNDGTRGLCALKKRGGLALVRTPGPGSEDATLEHAIHAGCTDGVLAVEAMPGSVLKHLESLPVPPSSRPNRDLPDDEIRASLGRICELLRRSTGHDFNRYKEGTLVRRIRRRIQIKHLTSAAEYVRRLQEDETEPGHLLKDLLIGVTQFFRDPDAFDVLAERVIPRLFDGKRDESRLRIWVPGCATGEEDERGARDRQRRAPSQGPRAGDRQQRSAEPVREHADRDGVPRPRATPHEVHPRGHRAVSLHRTWAARSETSPRASQGPTFSRTCARS